MANAKTTKDAMPSKSQIVEWWFNRDNSWYSGLEPYFIIHDIGEPDCWACKRYDPNFNDIFAYLEYMEISDEVYRKNPNKYIRAMWDAAQLERHHIVPVSRGGTDEISNLALLCSDCHANAPHVDNYNYFWTWLKDREKEILDKYVNAIKSACTSTGFNFEKDADFIHRTFVYYQLNKDKPGDLQQEMSKILTFHPYASWESYFRDEMVCLFSVVSTNPSLVPDTISKIIDGINHG